MKTQNLLVLGGGPGGYTAAFLAADFGMKVTLVDAEPKPGGVCLHRGCIPSKALLHIAKLMNDTRMASQWGLKYSEPEIDLGGIRRWKDQVISKMSSGLVTLAKKRGVNLLRGRGIFKDSNTLLVEGNQELKFDQAVVAVGSVPTIPPHFHIKSPLIMDSTSALEIEEIPKRLLIIGGGYIGLEMGTFYSALGSGVSVVEMTGGLLPGVDSDLVRVLQSRLKKEFNNIYLNTKVKSLEILGGTVNAVLERDGDNLKQAFDRVLVSVGRKPNSDGIGIEYTKAKIDNHGFLQVDSRQKTADPCIWAIGDVVGGAMLAHKASRQAKIAVESLAGEPAEFDNKAIPAIVFTDPEIAWCGMTETEAKIKGKEIEVASFPWGASGRASTLGRNDGLTKLIVEPETGRVLGVGMVGAGSGELIAEGVLAVEMGAVTEYLAATIHPHPTLSETIMEAAEVHLNRAIHIYKPR